MFVSFPSGHQKCHFLGCTKSRSICFLKRILRNLLQLENGTSGAQTEITKTLFNRNVPQNLHSTPQNQRLAIRKWFFGHLKSSPCKFPVIYLKKITDRSKNSNFHQNKIFLKNHPTGGAPPFSANTKSVKKMPKNIVPFYVKCCLRQTMFFSSTVEKCRASRLQRNVHTFDCVVFII